EHYKKITLHWLENIVDWNISRQIVWGIPIPAKICIKCEAGMVDLENKISKCDTCGGKVIQDNDTFDTWFSSGQWPFIALGYPESNDFKTFYPTDVMETGGDIIFFWVARMIMLGLYVTGELPFKTVYLHGMVLDAKSQKMSKSKGNVLDPLEFTEKFGTDAFRLGMVVGNTPGTSLALAEDRIRGYKNFANKIWNITRFVLDNRNPEKPDPKNPLVEEFENLREDITSDMENYRFYLAAEKIYHYVWHRFADEIIEESKKDKEVRSVLLPIWENCLKILHPFMPFITEEIWQTMNKENLLMVEKWPV
ncbi:MAG: class I tRNA ligase family protein, partial [Patescibacteria group bacterium]